MTNSKRFHITVEHIEPVESTLLDITEIDTNHQWIINALVKDNHSITLKVKCAEGLFKVFYHAGVYGPKWYRISD